MVRVVIFESLIICRASHVTKNSKCPSTKIITESILNYSGLFSQKSRQHIRRVSNRYLFQFLHQAILNFYSRDLPSIVLMTSIMVLCYGTKSNTVLDKNIFLVSNLGSRNSYSYLRFSRLIEIALIFLLDSFCSARMFPASVFTLEQYLASQVVI